MVVWKRALWRAMAGAMLVAGCAPATAWAQTAPSPGVDGLLEQLQLKAKVAPAQEFVTRTRPARPAPFLPVGTPHPDRAEKVMTPAELAAETASLDGTREHQQRRAGRVPPVVPNKPPTAAPAVKKTIQ